MGRSFLLLFALVLGSFQTAEAQTQPQYWYYCAPVKKYFPYVQTCPQPWQPVKPFNVPISPPAAQTNSDTATPAPTPQIPLVFGNAPQGTNSPVEKEEPPVSPTEPSSALPANVSSPPGSVSPEDNRIRHPYSSPTEAIPSAAPQEGAGDETTILLVILVLGSIVSYFANIRHMRRKRANERWRVACDAVKQNLNTLRRLRSQKVRVNDWGHEEDRGWTKEIGYFIEKVFLPNLSYEDSGLFLKYPKECDLYNYMSAVIEGMIAKEPARDVFEFFPGMDPIQYEHFCAERLTAAGWNARTTQASGDQGVDVIAEARGCRLVVQCKLYSQPVDNGAVQEIVGGKAFEDATYAAVVSNAGFTNSAKQLAAKAEVALLHHDQLEEYGRRLLAGLGPES